MNILKMTDEEINDFVDKLWNKKKEEIVEFLKKEIGEIAKQDKKQHKSLSNYRYYEKPKYFEEYKSITGSNGLYVDKFTDHELHQGKLEIGNMYSADTPNELLEREIKKRQLWFELEKHLKENNCLATNEDWKNKLNKYCVYYDFYNKTFVIHSWGVLKNNIIYSTNLKVLENYMNTLSQEDIKIMFDVE